MRTNCQSAAILLLLTGVSALAATNTDKIDALVAGTLGQSHTPGISVSVVSQGRVVLAKGYGLANVEWSAPAGPNTAYELLSVAKQFTAAAILLLVKEGKVSLDESLSSYLPDTPAEWKPVTVRHLLTHTSGIPDYTRVKGWRDSIRLDRSPEDLVRSTYGPLAFEPGSAWRYSNTNYYALGLIVEKVSGTKYGEFLERRIFTPLQMTSTRMENAEEIVPFRAAGYHWNGKALLNAPYVSPTQKWAAGAVLSTAGDMAKWAVALDAGTLLERDALARMWTPAKLSDGSETHYGFGNELEVDHGHRVAGHQGGGLAFNATLLHFPDDRLSVAVLGNLTQTPSRLLASRIAAVFLPDLSDEGSRGIPDPDPAITAALRRVLADAAQGKVDPSRFAARVVNQVAPFLERMGPRFLAPLGELRTFVLLERREEAEKNTLRYRAVFGKGKTLVWTFEVTKDGKILSLEPKEE